MAHHASGHHESVLSRRAGLRPVGAFCGLHQTLPLQQLRWTRLAQYISNVQSTVFRDCTPEEVLELHYKLLGDEGEPSLDKLPTAGLSAGYVARETRRAMADVQGTIPIYPGIDIDYPHGAERETDAALGRQGCRLGRLKSRCARSRFVAKVCGNEAYEPCGSWRRPA